MTEAIRRTIRTVGLTALGVVLTLWLRSLWPVVVVLVSLTAEMSYWIIGNAVREPRPKAHLCAALHAR
jgi:hypothetical protein